MSDQKPDHLIIRYLSNEASAIEQEHLFDWVSRSKVNQKIFNQYVSAWSAQLDRGERFNSTRALEKLSARINTHEKFQKTKTVFWNTWNVAAAIVLLIVAGLMLFQAGINSYHAHKSSLLTEFVTTSKLDKVTLSDGSVITLNSNSVLRYPEEFSLSVREVYLTGEAFFEVAKDTLKPFIIHTGDLTTRVVGTSFNILTTETRIVVSVATGSVSVSDGNTTESLKPFEKVTYNQHSLLKETTDLEELAWNDRTLKFEDVPLEDVAKKLEQHYEVKIAFESESLKKCVLTGKFKNEPINRILQAIEYSLNIKVTQKNKLITLSGKGCQ